MGGRSRSIDRSLNAPFQGKAKTPAERQRDKRARDRQAGIVEMVVKVPDTPEARASIRRSAARLCEEAKRVNKEEGNKHMDQSAPYSTLRTGNREYWGFSPGNWVAPKPGPWRNIPLSAVYWPSPTPSGLQSSLAADLPNGTLGDLADDVKHIARQDGVGPRSFGLLLLLIERAAADIDVTKKHDFPTEDEAAHFAQQARARWDAKHQHLRLTRGRKCHDQD